MTNTYKSTENHRLPLLVGLVLIGCDNCIRNYNPKHHLAPYVEKIKNLFELLKLVKKEWSAVAMETERNYILDIVYHKKVQLIEFRESITKN